MKRGGACFRADSTSFVIAPVLLYSFRLVIVIQAPSKVIPMAAVEQVNIISRRPKLHPTKKKQMPLVRGISNEAEIRAALEGIKGVAVRLVDLSSLDLRSQLEMICQTDILIGKQHSLAADSLWMHYKAQKHAFTY